MPVICGTRNIATCCCRACASRPARLRDNPAAASLSRDRAGPALCKLQYQAGAGVRPQSRSDGARAARDDPGISEPVRQRLLCNRQAAARRRRSGVSADIEGGDARLDDAIEVRVRDNGTGIAPEIRDKLFQPLSRQSRPAKAPGSVCRSPTTCHPAARRNDRSRQPGRRVYRIYDSPAAFPIGTRLAILSIEAHRRNSSLQTHRWRKADSNPQSPGEIAIIDVPIRC
jgi:histidine kinase/DNA gyrase B/HSP90-like ATPase